MNQHLQEEVDKNLKNGMTPMKCLNAMKVLIENPLWAEYKNVLPTIHQITNRKKVLGRRGEFTIDTVAEVEVIIFIILYFHYFI